ncbi:MAG: penicillin-binding protein 1C [Prolixibacteraceae bacterium]
MKAIENSKHKRWWWLPAVTTIALFFYLITPTPKFDVPTSTVVFSSDNELLGARISDDGQWRFPKTDSVPLKYETAVLTFEDQYFYYHPGINLQSLARALWLNLKNRKVVSGGSTISMQVARLSRKNPPRNIPGKLLEMAMAIKLELRKPKREILRLYASSAPFGGNVVGIDAAAWRYFRRPAHQLSWAEASTLAVLPNAPALIYPGRNSSKLKYKRDQLLQKLYHLGEIDTFTYTLALLEELPSKPSSLPNMASHLVEEAHKEYRGQRIQTSIQYEYQIKANTIVERHSATLAENDIHNLAALIVDVETGEILAYVGNSNDPENMYGGQVNIINSPRSTGSILKPFLFASMLHNGILLPQTLVKDVPINFAGYSPQNFDYTYSGAVPAANALSRSLNVPAVEMLHQYGEVRFLDVLKQLNFTTFNQSAEHYGLSLILGGGEASLLELAGAYASLARILQHFNVEKAYSRSDIFVPHYLAQAKNERLYQDQAVVSAAAIYETFEALQQVNRPEERSGWWNFSSSNKVAWKTGTSFGFRDAWAIATTPKFIVAVWAGNANGEGRAGLTGSKVAAPVLFDLMDFLPQSGWFQKPVEELTFVDVCAESGYIASSICPQKVSCEIPLSGLRTGACPYHSIIHLSEDRRHQVNSSCYPVNKMVHDSVFVLPPAMEWYYRKKHPTYTVLPSFLEGCGTSSKLTAIELISPRNLSKLYIPFEMNGERGKIVFEAAHQTGTRLFWHMDGTFIGETSQFHQMALTLEAGKHTLTIIDEDGNILEKSLNILSEKY